MRCPSCDRDLSYSGQPGHECYTYAEHRERIAQRPERASGDTGHGRVAQQAEHPVDRKPSGMTRVVDGEVAGSTPAPANSALTASHAEGARRSL